MADNSSNGVTTNSLIKSLQQSSSTTETKKNKNEIGKNEFLNMLVTQLKNQDPLNPMDGDQFAVNLAQFSQLEQLVDINGKLGSGGVGGSGDSSASLASYLGHEVVLNSNKIHVEQNNAGSVQVDLPSDAQDVVLELLDKDGKVVERKSLGAQSKGKHLVDIKDLDTQSGDYTYQMRAKTTTGADVKVQGKVAGLVEGYIPGADPKLLVGGREVAPSEVAEVRSAESAAS